MPLYWLPLLPLIGFAILILGGRWLPGTSGGWLGSGFIGAAFVVAVIRFMGLDTQAHETLWTWLPNMALGDGGLAANLRVGFYLDQLSAVMTLVITGVGFLIHLYSISYMHDDARFTRFFAFMNFFVAMMLILVLADSYPLMYVGWEGVGMASYLLIGFWFAGHHDHSAAEGVSNSNAARKAFIMNRVGDLGFMLGMFLIYKVFGTLVIPEIAAQQGTLAATARALPELICLFLLVGAVGKSGQLPLTTWLPDAMAGPTPVSALIHAATMVTAGVYLIARSYFFYDIAPGASLWVAWAGGLTALYGALSALNQTDIKKILAYSTVSQLGYMFLAVGLHSYTAAIFHLVTHAFFKALLFLAAGAVIHALHEEQDVRKMGGLAKAMPLTHFVSAIGVLAISGIPIFAGFFSKDGILASAFSQNLPLYFIGLFVAFLTAFYMGRWYFLVWRGEYRGGAQLYPHDGNALMSLPLGILAALATLGGFLNVPAFLFGGNHLLDTYLGRALPVHEHDIPVGTEWLITLVAVAVALGGLGWAYLRHNRRALEVGPLGQTSTQALYLDQFYTAVIGGGGRALAQGLETMDQAVDGAMTGIATNVGAPGWLVTLWQSGFVRAYALSMLLGTALIVGYWAMKAIGGGL